MLLTTPTRFLFKKTPLLFPSPSRRRIGCDRWRLHWGLVRELSHSISVWFSLLYFVLSIFVYNLCYVIVFGVCLSIYYIYVCYFPFYLLFCPFLFYTHMAPTALHTRWDIRPYTRVCVRHREWRPIFGHAGSLTCLIIVKPHLEFSSFDNAFLLVVPTATMLLPKRMISLETIKDT